MKAQLSTDIKSTLKECFATDPELISTYHIASGSGVDGCVDRTATDLAGAVGFDFYKLLDGDQLVGFFGVEKSGYLKSLTSFFLKPAYRKKFHVEQFWSLVDECFQGSPYISGIYDKNTRAARFLEKRGKLIGHVVLDNGSHGLVYGFNLGEVCH